MNTTPDPTQSLLFSNLPLTQTARDWIGHSLQPPLSKETECEGRDHLQCDAP